MSISHLFPQEGPTLNLNFAGSRTLDPRITFTRTQTTSNGSTYMDQNGLIRYAGPDEPRFDHRYVNGEVESLGLLIEEQRSNLLTGSDDFGPLYWTKLNSVGVSTNVTTSPDGTTNADKFVENTDASHKVLARSFTLTASTTYTFSIFVKSAERSNILIHVRKSDYTTRFGGFFNLTTKTFTGEAAAGGTLLSSSIVEYPNNWFRLTITGDIAANTAAVTTLYLCDTNNNIGYTGDGTSGIYIWGAQLEQGSFPTSYIPTEGSTKTRNQDRTLIDGEGFTEWYNPTEGTFFCTVNDPKGTVVFGVGDTFENTIYTTAGGAFSAAIRSGNVGTSLVGEISRVGTSKVALAVKTDNSSLCINGAITGSSLTADMPLSTLRLTIGASSWSPTAGDNQVGGTISQLTYYPRRLTNSQLQALTR